MNKKIHVLKLLARRSSGALCTRSSGIKSIPARQMIRIFEISLVWSVLVKILMNPYRYALYVDCKSKKLSYCGILDNFSYSIRLRVSYWLLMHIYSTNIVNYTNSFTLSFKDSYNLQTLSLVLIFLWTILSVLGPLVVQAQTKRDVCVQERKQILWKHSKSRNIR